MGDDEEKEQLKHDVANLRQQVPMLNEHIESYEKEAPNSSTFSSSHEKEKEKLMAEISNLISSFQVAEIQRMEDTVACLRRERDEAKDRLIIEQAKCKSASMENAALKARVDNLRLHINEQKKRFEDVMNEEAPDEIAEAEPAVKVEEIATTSPVSTSCKAPENTGMVTPLSIATAKTKHYELNSDLQMDKDEKDRHEAESKRLKKFAEGFQKRNVRNNGMLNPVVTTQENKKAKLAVAPKPMLANFRPFVIQSPAEKVD